MINSLSYKGRWGNSGTSSIFRYAPRPAGIAPFQLTEFSPLWQATKNMRLQEIHVSDIVEQHRKAVAIEKGFKEKICRRMYQFVERRCFAPYASKIV
jgi:hypothetical protein